MTWVLARLAAAGLAVATPVAVILAATALSGTAADAAGALSLISSFSEVSK